jgi:ferredoxin
MIIHYGYADGSGKYYVSIDAEKCDACEICIEKCPQKALKIDTVPWSMRRTGKRSNIPAPPVIREKKSIVCKRAKKGQLPPHGKRSNHIH